MRPEAQSHQQCQSLPLARRRSRAFWMSLANLGISLGLISASAVFLMLRKTFATTGWRLAMLLSAVTLLSYPAALAILSRRIALVTLLQFLITFFGLGLLHGLAPILTAETFPTKFRYFGTGISFGLAGVQGGMIGPPLLARLIGQDILDKWYYLPMIYAVYCAAAMLALLFIPETRDLRLEDLDHFNHERRQQSYKT